MGKTPDYTGMIIGGPHAGQIVTSPTSEYVLAYYPHMSVPVPQHPMREETHPLTLKRMRYRLTTFGPKFRYWIPTGIASHQEMKYILDHLSRDYRPQLFSVEDTGHWPEAPVNED